MSSAYDPLWLKMPWQTKPKMTRRHSVHFGSAKKRALTGIQKCSHLFYVANITVQTNDKTLTFQKDALSNYLVTSINLNLKRYN